MKKTDFILKAKTTWPLVIITLALPLALLTPSAHGIDLTWAKKELEIHKNRSEIACNGRGENEPRANIAFSTLSAISRTMQDLNTQVGNLNNFLSNPRKYLETEQTKKIKSLDKEVYSSYRDIDYEKHKLDFLYSIHAKETALQKQRLVIEAAERRFDDLQKEREATQTPVAVALKNAEPLSKAKLEELREATQVGTSLYQLYVRTTACYTLASGKGIRSETLAKVINGAPLGVLMRHYPADIFEQAEASLTHQEVPATRSTAASSTNSGAPL